MSKVLQAGRMTAQQLLSSDISINSLLENAHADRLTLYNDYKDIFSCFDNFLSSCHKESGFSRALTYRFLSLSRAYLLTYSQLDSFKEFTDLSSYYVSPLIYLRFSEPGRFLNTKHSNSFLYTEPHYDRSQKHDFYSIWIPLHTTNRETGTLCTFPGLEDLHSCMNEDGSNRYSLSSYLDSCADIDPVFKEHVYPVDCNEGMYLLWDSSVLHGAVKSVSKPRISINYQLFDLDDSRHDQDIESVACVLYSIAPLHFCSLMLLTYGDIKGYAQVQTKYSESLSLESTRLKNSELSFLSAFVSLSSFTPDRDVFPSTNRVHWSQDYSLLSGIIESGSSLKLSINSYLAKFDERF